MNSPEIEELRTRLKKIMIAREIKIFYESVDSIPFRKFLFMAIPLINEKKVS